MVGATYVVRGGRDSTGAGGDAKEGGEDLREVEGNSKEGK
jgi:hypothetical protein